MRNKVPGVQLNGSKVTRPLASVSVSTSTSPTRRLT